jgi:hypothetical protein
MSENKNCAQVQRNEEHDNKAEAYVCLAGIGRNNADHLVNRRGWIQLDITSRLR